MGGILRTERSECQGGGSIFTVLVLTLKNVVVETEKIIVKVAKQNHECQ